jgi:hypothetical protein
LVIVAALTACTTSKPPTVGPQGLGFQCLPIPSQWNAAGSVIGVTDGVVFQLGQVDGITAQDGDVAVPSYSSTTTVEAGVVLKTLEAFTAAKGWAANIGVNAKGTVDITTSYGGDTKLIVTLGQPEPIATAWFKAKGYKLEPGTSYFLVREAIQATEINYEVKRSDLVKIGGNATVQAVEGAFKLIDRASSDSYTLKATVPKALNVCIKPKELVATGLSATGEQILETRDVTSPILPLR